MDRYYQKKIFSFIIDTAKSIIKRVLNKKEKQEDKEPTEKVSDPEVNKIHPWRLCGIGRHQVRTHTLTIPATKKRPAYVTPRDWHCANNPPRKNGKLIDDYLSKLEADEIAERYFSDLDGPPFPGLEPEYTDGDKYDDLIRGWTNYWNDVLKPKEPLDANLVKALMGSESSFKLNPTPQNTGTAGQALGLMQLTEQAIKALNDPDGELKNHLIEISKKDVTLAANITTCAAIRWLFHKKRLASHRLKREATWVEAVEEYKSYLKDIVSGKNKNPEGMKKFWKIYSDLTKSIN